MATWCASRGNDAVPPVEWQRTSPAQSLGPARPSRPFAAFKVKVIRAGWPIPPIYATRKQLPEGHASAIKPNLKWLLRLAVEW